MIPASQRFFTPAEDEIIKAHHGRISSNAIGRLMTPERPGSAIRIRARRLKLEPVNPRAFVGRPSLDSPRPAKPRKPGVVPLRCLNSNIDGMPAFDPIAKAADFIRWREARA